MLQDSFGRTHTYLRLSLTERCNLRCFYCMPEEGIVLKPREEIMRREEILDIAGIFVSLGIKKIRLTGGEPLIRKDAPEIIRSLGKLPIELVLTSNGILVDRFMDIFKEAGISKLNISLDSLIPEKQFMISKRDFFHRIYKNIFLLLENDFQVKVNMVVIRDVNHQEVNHFIRLTKEYPLDIRFIEFMPFRKNAWDLKRCISQDTLMEQIVSEFGKEHIQPIPLQDHFISRDYKIQGYSGRFGFISTVTKPFCEGCNRIRLTADGKMKNCLFSNNETDLLTAYRRGENIIPMIRHSLMEKKKIRAGMETNEDFENGEKNQQNRTMISIGG